MHTPRPLESRSSIRLPYRWASACKIPITAHARASMLLRFPLGNPPVWSQSRLVTTRLPPVPTRGRFDQGLRRSPRLRPLISPPGPRGRGLKSLLWQVRITHAQYHSDHLGHVAALRFDLFSQGVTECRCDLERDNHLIGLDLADGSGGQFGFRGPPRNVRDWRTQWRMFPLPPLQASPN